MVSRRPRKVATTTTTRNNNNIYSLVAHNVPHGDEIKRVMRKRISAEGLVSLRFITSKQLKTHRLAFADYRTCSDAIHALEMYAAHPVHMNGQRILFAWNKQNPRLDPDTRLGKRLQLAQSALSIETNNQPKQGFEEWCKARFSKHRDEVEPSFSLFAQELFGFSFRH